MNEHHLEVRRSARIVTLGERGAALSDLWIVCHGYGQLAHSFAKPFAPLARAGRLIVVPEALNRYYIETSPERRGPDAKVGATWMTKEDRQHEIADYVGYLDQVGDWALEGAERRAVKLTVLGFSQGVATVCRWVALGRIAPERLVLWAGEIPPDLDSSKLSRALDGVEVVLVAGDQDQFATPKFVAATETAVRKIASRVEVIRFAGGHSLNGETLLALSS